VLDLAVLILCDDLTNSLFIPVAFDIEINTMSLPQRSLQQEPLPTSRDTSLIQSHISQITKDKPNVLTLQMIFNRHRGFLESLPEDSPTDETSDNSPGADNHSDDEEDVSNSQSSSHIPSALLARLLRLELLALTDMGLTAIGGMELIDSVKIIMLQRNKLQVR
jgi:hypothetical protein